MRRSVKDAYSAHTLAAPTVKHFHALGVPAFQNHGILQTIRSIGHHAHQLILQPRFIAGQEIRHQSKFTGPVRPGFLNQGGQDGFKHQSGNAFTLFGLRLAEFIQRHVRMDEMGCEFVETTAHGGARPSHAEWQGRRFHRGGAVDYKGRHYPDFEAATGYGTGAGLCGWNCRHQFFACFPELGDPPQWTQEQLQELNARNIEYNGKKYTAYEISQMQRARERNVRRWKKRYLAEDAAGLDTTDSAVRLRAARQSLAEFAQATGGRVDSARVSVPKFGRSEASRASAQARKVEPHKVQSTRGSGGASGQNGKTVRKVLGKVDTTNTKQVDALKNSFCSGYAKSDVEHMMVITKDGEVHYMTDNNPRGVDCSYLGGKLEGSYNIHTHPPKTTQYSFSTDADIPGAFADGTAVMEAVDYKYRYRFVVPENITFEQWEAVCEEVREERNAVMESRGYGFDDYEENIQHVIIDETCRRLGLKCYHREKRT